MIMKHKVRIARFIDEPIVLSLYQKAFPNYFFYQSKQQEDWKHIDIVGHNKKDHSVIYIDVKRRSKETMSSPYFTFSIINTEGKPYTYWENGVVAFIDEYTGQILTVAMKYIEQLSKIKKHHKGHGKSYYIMIDYDDINRWSAVHRIDIPEKELEILRKNH